MDIETNESPRKPPRALHADSKNRSDPPRDSDKTLHIAQRSLSRFAILYRQSVWEIG